MIPPLLFAAWVHQQYPTLEWNYYLLFVGAPFTLWGALVNASINYLNGSNKIEADLAMEEAKNLAELQKENDNRRREMLDQAVKEFAASSVALYSNIHLGAQSKYSTETVEAELGKAEAVRQHYSAIPESKLAPLWDEFIQTARLVHGELSGIKSGIFSQPKSESLKAIYGKEELGIQLGRLKLEIEAELTRLRRYS
jgi:hypothetical protein